MRGGERIRAPRWGVQARFVRRGAPAFRLYVLLLALGGSLFAAEQIAMAGLPRAYALSWLLMLAYALPIAAVIYRLDLFEREPRSFLVAAAVWGAVVAVGLAGPADGAWQSVFAKLVAPEIARDWGPAVVAPGVEETLKLAGVATIYLIARSELDGVLDGFVYGAMVGLGFTVAEDVLYFMNAAAASGTALDQPGPVIDTFVIRVIGGGLYGHVLFTGLTGIGFAYLVTKRGLLLRRFAVGASVVAAGVLAHALWNSPVLTSVLETESGHPSALQWLELGTLKGLPFLLLLGLLVALATRTEDRAFATIVADEVAPESDVLTPAELASLRSLWSRRAARKRARRTGGGAAELLTGELQRAQLELGLALSAATDRDDPAVERQRLRIREIRAELTAPGAPVDRRPTGPR